MENGINLIMPMGGKGSRFFENGFVIPKPLIKIKDKPFLFWSTQAVKKFVELKSLTFVVLQEHIDKFSIDKEILSFFPEADIIVIPQVLNGAVLTCMEGVKNINNSSPIIFNDCDHTFFCPEFYNYCKNGNFDEIDGALLTFKSDDSKFSYLKCDEFGNAIKTVEKEVISNDAICGAYYFKNRNIFEEAVNEYLKECNYSEYFVSGVYNIMIKNKKIVRQFRLESHLPFGTPQEYNEALESQDFEVYK